MTSWLISLDVIASETMPRSAARRPARPPSIAITPAIANQSIDRLALLLNCLRERADELPAVIMVTPAGEFGFVTSDRR